MAESLRTISPQEATGLYIASRQPGDPAYLHPILEKYAKGMPEPSADPGAPEQIHEHMDNGGRLMIAVGPHLTDLDQLGVGGSFLKLGLSRVALSTRTLARAENWYDHGMAEAMEFSGAIPVHRRNRKNPRFSAEVIDATEQPLNQLVVASVVEDEQNIMLFVSGTRYRAENDPEGHGPYENIPVRPGVERFSNLILQEYHARGEQQQREEGKLALVCMGIYAPESDLYAPPHTHITRPHLLELGPKQEPVEMLGLVSTEVHRAARLARAAAGAITIASR